MIDVRGLPIAITGASSGIGAATAIACAEAGMPVALAARRLDKLEEIAGKIREGGGRAVSVECDVTDPEACERLIERTVSEFGSVYAVFANAGYGFEKAVFDASEREHRDIFETNFWGTINTIRPAIEHMKQSGRGHVLMCSSCLSKISIPYYAAYCSTKACQDMYGRALRYELAGDNIYVSTVHPIGTRTELRDEIARRLGNRPRLSDDDRMQPPERVAKAVVKCLRKPRTEVWTSMLRYALAFGVAAPGFRDAVLARKVRKRLAEKG